MSAAERLFAGPGEMRERCRAHDWGATPLGTADRWPPALRTLAPVVVAAGLPSALLWGPELTFIYNDAYIPLIGGQHPQVLGRRLFDAAPETRETFEPLLARVRAGETVSVADVPTTFRRDDPASPATTSVFTFSFAPVREMEDPAAPVVGIHVIVVETTSQVALRASETRLRRMFNIEGVGVLIFNAAGRLLDANDFFLAMTGYSRAMIDAGGLTWRDLTPPEYVAESELQMQQIEVNGRIGPYDKEYLRADGSRSWLLFAGAALGDGTVVEYCIDVSNLKRAEEALAQSAARDAFLVSLADALRPLDDPVEIQATATRVLGEHLGADRVLYAEVEPDDEHVVIRRDYAKGIPSDLGRFKLRAFGPSVARAYREGRRLAVADVHSEPTFDESERTAYEAVHVRAHLSVPLVKGGRLVAVLSAQHAEPRVWRADELQLVDEVSERTWAAVERARAEMELRASEAKYRMIFDSIDQGFTTLEVLYDADGHAHDLRYLEANRAFEQQTGLSDNVGRTAREVLPHLEDAWVEIYAHVVRTGESVRFERYNTDTNRWYSVYLSRVNRPESAEVATVFTDITERKRREANLTFLNDAGYELVGRASVDEIMIALGAKIGAHFAVSQCSFAEIDEAARTATVKYAWLAGGRADPADFRPQRLDDYVSDSLYEAARRGEVIVVSDTRTDPRTSEQAFAARGIRAFLTIPFVRDGAWRATISITSIVPRSWRDDEIELLRELTTRIWTRIARARAESVLRDTQHQLDDALATARMGYWQWDPATGVTTASPSMDDLFGGLAGQRLESRAHRLALVHPDDRVRYETLVEQGHLRGEGWHTEFRIIRPRDGEVAWLEEEATAATDPQTGLPRTTGLVRDITDRKRSDAAAARERAGHERNALRRQLLEAEEGERRRLARELHDEAGQHLTALGLGLRALSDIVAADSEVNQRAAELYALLNTMGQELHAVAVRLRPKALDDFGLETALAAHTEEWSRKTGISMDMHIEPGPERLPSIVESALYRIVQEALTNVARHSGATRVSVVVERTDGHVIAIVEDDGHGFDVEAHNGALREARGLGLLGIRERAALLGGTAEVESTLGEGTTIFVRVPVER